MLSSVNVQKTMKAVLMVITGEVPFVVENKLQQNIEFNHE
jgi:hypothetical protein